MAQNTTKNIGTSYTQLTDADVTSITFQNRGGDIIFVQGAASASAPTNDIGALLYRMGQGEANASLSDLFPGIAGVRVYARALTTGAEVMVSHA